MFKSDGFEIVEINAQRDPIPVNTRGYDGIIVLGGPMAVYDNLPSLEREQELIRDAIMKDVPLLGICLGSQLIAQAAGGHVYKGKKKEIGWYDVYVTPASSNDIFRGITDKKIRVFQWHGDTYDLPNNAKMLAYCDDYPQAFRIGSAVGIQFHLEVDGNAIALWMKEYSQVISAEKIKPENVQPLPGDVEHLAASCRLVYDNFSKVLK